MKHENGIELSNGWVIPWGAVSWQAIRSQGAGGQNVNKVATAVQLRFDIAASLLPEAVQQRLRKLSDRRVTKDGYVIIKAQSHRTQVANREEALKRLRDLVESVLLRPKTRLATRPPKRERLKRLAHKRQRSEIKSLRRSSGLSDG
ncbi:MAG: alternative ribosome rescue aminoacyl-tRNA hydrolase ArfB [Hydrogenovibrio sp.]